MYKYIRVTALSVIILAALLACSDYSSGYNYSYHTTKHTSSYSYPVNYGSGCVQTKKTKIKITQHPIYGTKIKRTTRRTTIC